MHGPMIVIGASGQNYQSHRLSKVVIKDDLCLNPLFSHIYIVALGDIPTPTAYFIPRSPTLSRRLAINRISLFAACLTGAASWFHAAVRYS